MNIENNDKIDPLDEGPVKITRASFALQDKAGTGEIDIELIRKADQVLQDNEEDFTPIALAYMTQLAAALANIKNNNLRDPALLLELEGPVMQLKANGKMFKYDLATSLSSIMLDFLESVGQLDDDVIALVEAHLASLQVILAKKIKGTGGLDGLNLKTELEEACQRYYKKNPLSLKK